MRSTAASCARSLMPRTSRSSAATCATTGMPSAHRRRDDVGQVELALRVVRLERGDPAREQRGRRGHDAGVDLVGSRAARRCASRSSTIARTRPAASRTMRPSPAGSGTFAVSTARWPGFRLAHQRGQRVRGHERDVADRHERHAVAGQRIAARRAPRRRCRAADPAARTRGRARRAPRAPASAPWPTTTAIARGASERAAASTCATSGRPAERMQHLGQRRVHPLALAGGEDDDVERGGHGIAVSEYVDGAGRRAGHAAHDR